MERLHGRLSSKGARLAEAGSAGSGARNYQTVGSRRRMGRSGPRGRRMGGRARGGVTGGVTGGAAGGRGDRDGGGASRRVAVGSKGMLSSREQPIRPRMGSSGASWAALDRA